MNDNGAVRREAINILQMKACRRSNVVDASLRRYDAVNDETDFSHEGKEVHGSHQYAKENDLFYYCSV